jgi:hypothetical protein
MISKLIKKLANRPAKDDELDKKDLESLLSLLKSNQEVITVASREILQIVQKPHAQARFNCLLMLDAIFNKSATFRNLVLDRTSLLVECFLDQDIKPQNWSLKLKHAAKRTFNSWNHIFPNNPRLVGLVDVTNSRDFRQLEVTEPTDAREVPCL